MRPHRTGTYTSRGQFKTTRQYIAPDGLKVRQEFIQRKGESERKVTIRADKWLSENLGKLPTMVMPLERAIELYIEDREGDDLRPVSLRDDKFSGELLKSALGVVRIDALDAFGIEYALKPWKDKPRTAKKIRDFGRKLYKWLAKRGWVDISRNPFQQARAPKYAPAKWQEPITPAHFAKAMEHVTRDDYRAVLLLLRWTGMRPKSARELTWPEVEERDGRMWIRKVSAKTKAGTRPVMVRKEAADALRALPKSSVFVFPSAKTGKPYNETTIMGAWRDAQTLAKLTPRPLYDLKHMRVTELAEEFDDVTVAYAVGLDSADAIRNNYRQIDGDKLAKKIEQM